MSGEASLTVITRSSTVSALVFASTSQIVSPLRSLAWTRSALDFKPSTTDREVVSCALSSTQVLAVTVGLPSWSRVRLVDCR